MKIRTLLALTVVLITILACEKKEGIDTNPFQSEIIGKWILTTWDYQKTSTHHEEHEGGEEHHEVSIQNNTFNGTTLYLSGPVMDTVSFYQELELKTNGEFSDYFEYDEEHRKTQGYWYSSSLETNNSIVLGDKQFQVNSLNKSSLTLSFFSFSEAKTSQGLTESTEIRETLTFQKAK